MQPHTNRLLSEQAFPQKLPFFAINMDKLSQNDPPVNLFSVDAQEIIRYNVEKCSES